MCLAVPAKIEKIKKDSALVDFGGVKREISLGLLNNVHRGDYVLVHAGFAITKIKEEEALDILKTLEELRKISSP